MSSFYKKMTSSRIDDKQVRDYTEIGGCEIHCTIIIILRLM